MMATLGARPPFASAESFHLCSCPSGPQLLGLHTGRERLSSGSHLVCGTGNRLQASGQESSVNDNPDCKYSKNTYHF